MRSTWPATVDPVSRRDRRGRRRAPITSWQAPAWRAARISPEAVSLALTSSNVPCSSPRSRASWSNLAAGGRSRLSIARTCTPAEPGTGQPGEMGGVANQPFAGGRPLQGDHDDRGRHRLADAVSGGERRDRTGNRVIEPELRELLQRGEIREPERGTAPHPPALRGQPALGQPVPQRRRRQVDEPSRPFVPCYTALALINRL